MTNHPTPTITVPTGSTAEGYLRTEAGHRVISSTDEVTVFGPSDTIHCAGCGDEVDRDDVDNDYLCPPCSAADTYQQFAAAEAAAEDALR